MDLQGSIVKINQVSEKQLKEMYSLMAKFYNNITKKNFTKDFLDKDFCIILKDEKNKIKGFSTQKILKLNYEGKDIHGVFSGDTVIHKENWGSFPCSRSLQNFSLHMGNSMRIFTGFLL